MANVTFKRTNNIDSVPITDGQLIFDTSDQKIYLDNGNTREVYGGGSGTDLISNVSDATDNNAFNANATVNLFTRKSSIVDTKAEIQSVTQAGVPLGCKGFNEVIGTGDISALGDGSVTGAILANKSAIDTVNQNLTNCNTRVNLDTNYLQYRDENGVWQDIFSISPTIVSNILTLPLSANSGDGYSITTNSGNSARAYTWFNDGSTLNIQSGTYVNLLLTSPIYVKQLRARIGNLEGGSIRFRVTYDGVNWVDVGSNLIAGGVQESTFKDNTLQLNATIMGFGVSCYKASGASYTNMNFGSIGAYA